MLFLNSAASDFGYGEDMLGNPPIMDCTGLPMGVFGPEPESGCGFG